MKNEELNSVRRLSICDILNAKPKARRELGAVDVGGQSLPAIEGRITLAMSRDVRANTKHSVALAMQIAERNADVQVVYLNTYAGVELMQEAFGRREPPPGPLLASQEGETTTPQPPPLTEEGEFDCRELQNLSIINTPFGDWDIDRLMNSLLPRREPMFYGPGDVIPKSEPMKHLVFVLSDFELAGFSAWHRQKVARDLIQVCELTGATIVVFSHEIREELSAGQAGRGALGLLAIKADVVERLFGEFDHLVKTRNQPKQTENADVHEAQTQVTEAEAPLKLTRNSLEAGEDLFEIPILRADLRQPLSNPPLLQGEGFTAVTA